MKKITLTFFLLLTAQFCLYAQYTAIPDPNFEAALIAGGYDSEGIVDNQILTSDCTSQSTLNIISAGVANFTGLEAFINLTNLDVSFNPDISTLDISQNTQLTNLNIRGNNLGDIDISSNLSLETIDFRENQLSSIDLSNLPALLSVNLKQNVLSFLDMRNGSNENIIFFDADFNDGLLCVFVDDKTAAYLQTVVWTIDLDSTYVDDEAECNTLSTAENVVDLFNIYPIPANDIVFVTSTAPEATIELFDILGNLVFRESIGLGTTTLDVSSLSDGLYVSKLFTEGRSQTIKFVIK